MGEPGRAYGLIEKTCMTEKHWENIDDANKFLILSIYNGLMHCGNCGKRMKCATDLFSVLKEETDVKMLLNLMDLDGSTSDELASTVIEIFDVLDENLTENQKYEIVNIFWDNLGIEPDEFVKIFDEIYSKCDQYNHNPVKTETKNNK